MILLSHKRDVHGWKWDTEHFCRVCFGATVGLHNFFNGATMFTTFEQAKQTVLEKGIEVIDLKFCDLWGRWHHLTIPASQFELKLSEEKQAASI